MGRIKGRAVIGVLTLALLLSTAPAAFASSTSAKKVKVNVGSMNVQLSKKLHIAFFTEGTSNAYLIAGVDGAKAQAKKDGASLTVFDSAFNTTTQQNQIQSAMTSRKYNAFVVMPVTSTQDCHVLSYQAPKAGILVSVILTPLCGRSANAPNNLWQKGTLNFVGGSSDLASYSAWAADIQSTNPGPQEVGVLVGPQGNVPSILAEQAFQTVTATNPNFKIVGTQMTDYSSAEGLTYAEDMIQANPGLTILATNYSELTMGAIAGLKATGKLGTIKLYDYGADPTVLSAIASGEVTMTTPYYPGSAAKACVQALVDAVNGTKVKRVVLNDGAPKPSFQGSDPILFITKANVSKFKSEY
jgi:ribose transport system substrate-binding protein